MTQSKFVISAEVICHAAVRCIRADVFRLCGAAARHSGLPSTRLRQSLDGDTGMPASKLETGTQHDFMAFYVLNPEQGLKRQESRYTVGKSAR